MALLLVLNAEAVSTATPAGPEATMTVTPAQGTGGSLLSLAGSGLPADRRAGLFLGHRRLARFRTDHRGDWNVRTRIPLPGEVRTSSLRVVIARHQMIMARFPVTATGAAGDSATSLAVLSSGEQVRLSPTRAGAGSSVGLIGTGFKHHGAVAVWLDGTRLVTVRASSRGALRASPRIPVDTRQRTHVLSLRFRQRRLSLRLAVTSPAVAGAAPPPGSAPSGSPPATGSPPPPPSSDPVVDAVGDMGCAQTDNNYNNGNGVPGAVYPANNCVQKSVSDLIANPLPSALLDLGDNQYNNGELLNYNTVYGPAFGRANSVVYPSIGNAEYNISTSAAGFFGYFGNTGVLSRIQADGGNNTNLNLGYYSFNLGAWHIIALNSNCVDLTGGCGAGSPEEKWLKADLAAHPGTCTLAYWHHPRWNSGSLGNDTTSAAFWTDLYAHAAIVLNGHGNHHYERFTPQNASGAPDVNGIREFIVSTGGQSHGVSPATPGDPTTSQLTNYKVFGMLRLTLHPTGYDYRYVAAGGSTFTDAGSGTCHS